MGLAAGGVCCCCCCSLMVFSRDGATTALVALQTGSPNCNRCLFLLAWLPFSRTYRHPPQSRCRPRFLISRRAKLPPTDCCM